jgi:hypothetical protein
MQNQKLITPVNKAIVASLLIAVAAVTVQIIAGAPYPPVPPVFFILLIPAALIVFGRWQWTPVASLLVGCFLTQGLFTSGAYKRLLQTSNWGDSMGLWIQSAAMLLVIILSMQSIMGQFKKHKNVRQQQS